MYSASATNYYFMYEDGTGAFNVDCTRSTPAGCWAHRDNILNLFSAAPSACGGRPTVLAMGAAEVLGRGARRLPSFAEVMSESCGSVPPSVAMTWTQASRPVG